MITMNGKHMLRSILPLFLLLGFVAAEAPGKGPADSLEVGEEAPTFVMLDAATDAAVFLRDFTGKTLRQPWKNKTRNVVVVSFWASWCEPCKEEIPVLMKLTEEFKDQAVRVFLVNTGEAPTFTKDSVRAVTKRRGYTLQCLLDNTGTVARRYSVQSLPVLVVVDKFGVVRKINRGYHQDFEQELRTLIPELLKEPEQTQGSN